MIVHFQGNTFDDIHNLHISTSEHINITTHTKGKIISYVYLCLDIRYYIEKMNKMLMICPYVRSNISKAY